MSMPSATNGTTTPVQTKSAPKPQQIVSSMDVSKAQKSAPEYLETTKTSKAPDKKTATNLDDCESVNITDVWADNLEAEMEKIIKIVEKHPFIAMDTEFPGVVVRPVGNFRNSSEYHYQTLRCNVNLLKIIQLGLTFADQYGNIPAEGKCTWQFHFKFNLKEDMYAQESIELLANSGIDFKKHEEKGIDVQVFGELMMSSGIVLSDEVRWISFHSAYDFGYLIKMLTNNQLPESEIEFFDLLHTYFPFVYDIKYLMKSCENLKGGLNQLADDLKISRIGPAHQAGSDSLLTLHTFFKMMKLFFENKFDDEKYLGILYGLGQGAVSEPTGQNQFNVFIPQGHIINDHTKDGGSSTKDQQLTLSSQPAPSPAVQPIYYATTNGTGMHYLS